MIGLMSITEKERLLDIKVVTNIKHLGDICKINGAEIPVVDIITFGAPCQDISVAGKRKGMLNENRGDDETTRSGLFFEAIRIIREMREHDRATKGADVDIRFLKPRYAIYENVPGAFSSNKGADFQAVLEEIIKIVRKETPTVPIPKYGWPKAGCISGVGDSGVPFSIAYRVHDAQFWGVPQRRKRIALVADFNGLSAGEILFERKGLFGYLESSSQEGKGSAGSIETGIGESDMPG